MTSEKENKTITKTAVIYCRVSSVKQSKQGHGLESQETRCRQYAELQGYEVEAVFPDDVSGGGDFMKRPGMVALLSYLKAQPDKNYVVIFDDLKRFARDTEFHFKLRRMFAERGAQVECLNFKFEDSPEGKFIETIIAAQGELERQQNGRQVSQKMQARMAKGYWVFRAPMGYKYEDTKEHGKLLVRDEPMASIITEAMEGYALGRFETQSEVKRYFESHPIFPKNQSGYVSQQRVVDIFIRPIYAGYIHHQDWKLNWIKAKHEPLVSLQTFDAIQKRRNGFAKAPMRKNINHDFPLRGFVLCGDCNKPYTACWSKGRLKKYAYYLCDTKNCVSYRKSIPRDKIENGFADIVRTLRPTDDLFALAKVMFKNAWDQRGEQAQALIHALKAETKLIEKQIEGLLNRVINTSSSTMIDAYETKIEGLEQQRRIMSEKLQNTAPRQGRFEDFIEHALNFLANPYKLWASEQFNHKRTVLRLAFSDRIIYHREKGYRTPKMSLPFKVLSGFETGEIEMVGPVGLEPTTRPL